MYYYPYFTSESNNDISLWLLRFLVLSPQRLEHESQSWKSVSICVSLMGKVTDM